MATKKATKKATTRKASTEIKVSFASEIPSISRERGTRKSKYDELLDQIKERAEAKPDESVACLPFDNAGQATSRYTSIKSAAERREDAAHWTIVTRSGEGDTVNLYVQWNDTVDAQDEK